MGAFRLAIFDFDGTLFDTQPAVIHCIQRTFAASGRTLPAVDAIADTIKTGVTLRDTFIALDASLRDNETPIESLIGFYRGVYATEADLLQKPYPAIHETLQELQCAGIRNVIISNKGTAAVRRAIDSNGLRSLIDFVFANEPDLPNKPDPAVLTDHIIPRYADVSKDKIVVVGDTETDILFAKAAGLASCWVSYGYGEPERCRGLTPDYEISAFDQLTSLVRPTHE